MLDHINIVKELSMRIGLLPITPDATDKIIQNSNYIHTIANIIKTQTGVECGGVSESLDVTGIYLEGVERIANAKSYEEQGRATMMLVCGLSDGLNRLAG